MNRLILSLALIFAVAACSGAVVDDPTSEPRHPSPKPTPTRALIVLCARGSYASPSSELRFDVTCEGAPVISGLRCNELAELPADIECSLQQVRDDIPQGEPGTIPAGSEDVRLRFVPL